MNLGEMITGCRVRADDRVRPYLWSDEEWTLFLNEAVAEACIRANLIVEDDIELAIEDGVTKYPVDVLDILSITVNGTPLSGWNLTPTHLLLAEPIDIKYGTMRLEVTRLPKTMTGESDTPEIHAMHHLRLLDWALRCSYLKQDSETFDPSTAEKYEVAFGASFGKRNDANVLRKHRRKTARTVRPINF